MGLEAGIGALAGGEGLLGGLFGGAEAAGALGAGEAAAGAGAADALGTTAGGLSFIDASGAALAPAGASLTVNAAPAAAGGFGEVLGGIGSALGAGASAVGNALFPAANAGEVTGSGAGGGLSAPSSVGTIPQTPNERVAGGFQNLGGGSGAQSFSAPAGVTATPDATSAAASPVDAQGNPLPGGQGAAPGTTPADSLGVNPSSPAYGSNPLTPYGTPNPAYDVPGAAGGVAPNAAAPTAEKGIMESLGLTGKNIPGAAIGAAGLGYSVLQGQKQSAYAQQMAQQAASLNAQGQQLYSYLQNGNLPPGLQASLKQATDAAKSKIISNFASQNMNTDPNQNTALAAELAAVDQQALISTAQIGQQLLSSGVSETGLSSQLYTTLAGIDQTQTANIGKAIASFASAVSGGGPRIQIGGSSNA